MRTGAEVFLVAGGRDSRHEGDRLLADILAHIGLAHPSVAYLGAASNDSDAFFVRIASLLEKAGAGPVRPVALASPSAELRSARGVLEASDLVFVGGGDVQAGMCVLERTGFSPLLKELHQAGKSFVGVSAGSIMLARYWVFWADPDDDKTAQVFACLGLAPLICDTHGEKEDWEELRTVLRLTRESVGYGIPAGSALWVSEAGHLAALGKPVHRFTWRNGSEERMDDLPVA